MHSGRSFHAVFLASFCLLIAASNSHSDDLKEELIKPDHLQAIYNHLLQTHWVPQTGFFASFPDSRDAKLSQQASTYEQGLMGWLAVQLGDFDRARRLLQSLISAWKEMPAKTGRYGLAAFYNAEFGGIGIERTTATGANAWAGLFAARLGNATQDAEATQFALDIAYWIANSIPHQNGAVAVAPYDDPTGARWSRIFSTENNLSYYALLTELLRCPRLHKEEIISITRERDGVENWLLNTALDRKTYRLVRGITPYGRDPMSALDTATWFISAIGPKRLAARGIDPYRLMNVAQKSFEVTVGGHQGVDATNQTEADYVYSQERTQAFARPASDKHRLIWYEGLGQYILAWSQVAQYEDQRGQPPLAHQIMDTVRQLTKAFDDGALAQYPNQSAYPYATPGLFFRDGWRAAAEGRQGPASSISAAVWRCLSGLGVDPVAGQDLDLIRQVQIRVPKDSELALRPRPKVLYGTSEAMTLRAWKAMDKGDWEGAIAQARATVTEWGPMALQLASQKRSEVNGLIDYTGKEEERRRIFKYWALNDVAASYFILGKALDVQKNYPAAAQAFQQITDHYALAQVWDPHGWFWAPADAVKDEYVLANPRHYQRVVPELLADAWAGKLPN